MLSNLQPGGKVLRMMGYGNTLVELIRLSPNTVGPSQLHQRMLINLPNPRACHNTYINIDEIKSIITLVKGGLRHQVLYTRLQVRK